MKKVPRLKFAHLPTPIEELPRLSGILGGPRLFFVKRDDQTGLAFGGNKTRKLEFLVAEAQEQGARTLISCGAIQSNHWRQFVRKISVMWNVETRALRLTNLADGVLCQP